ncbi:unnamed protein product [Brassicogethes aeneus]|uniref:F-box domain-containing protein n=1 Tax=Brassicogethes aeneus TaxID=1431903 RepID=A0A9P0B031_BRAAE|nr:unnamed protein product [Brassicogethes aeneus]
MVSTRQMTIVNNGNETNQLPSETGPAKLTRNSAIQTIGTVQFNRLVQSKNLLDLPEEVLGKIFSYLSFKNVCHLRLVCRTIDRVCGHILNSTFLRLQTQMLQRFQDIKSKMPRRESARRSHYLAGESDIVETLHMRLTLLQMTFGKHIERRHCYFFPGEILDEVYRILYYIRVTQKLDLPYKVTDELFDLSTMAMEYFKDKIEPNLPEIAYFSPEFLNFSGSSSSKFLHMDSSNLVSDISKESNHDGSDDAIDPDDLVDPIPQSNMVLRKRIRKIKQGMKKYNSQLSDLRQALRSCKRKTADQQKQITEQQKQLAEQQKQTLEYATRLDEYDKKNEESSRKFSTLLQELNKCKTELQYWRCKSPATSFCTSCGNAIDPQPDELQALLKLEASDLNLVCAGDGVAGKSECENAAPVNVINNKDKELDLPSVSPICIKNNKRKLDLETKEESTSSKKKRRPSKIRKVKAKV